MTRINYSTPYTDGRINGYVMAEDKGDYYTITKAAYNRACKKMTVGNTCPQFHAEKHVYVEGVDF